MQVRHTAWGARPVLEIGERRVLVALSARRMTTDDHPLEKVIYPGRDQSPDTVQEIRKIQVAGICAGNMWENANPTNSPATTLTLHGDMMEYTVM